MEGLVQVDKSLNFPAQHDAKAVAALQAEGGELVAARMRSQAREESKSAASCHSRYCGHCSFAIRMKQVECASSDQKHCILLDSGNA